MTTASLHYTHAGRVARVKFTSPKGVQLLGPLTRAQLSAILDELETADDCRVVVFEAEGRTFFGGADIHEMSRLDADSAEAFSREGQSLLARIADLPAVSVAAIHAASAGGGTELAFACDLRMAGASATIGLPEVSIGLVPGWGGTVRAARLFGTAIARRLILAGELFPASQAHELGIVDSVAPDAQFRAAVDARVDELLSNSPFALRAVKRLLADFEGPDIDGLFAAEAQAFAACFADGEAKDGLLAFLEKRAATWM